jgi:hypothetical protein
LTPKLARSTLLEADLLMASPAKRARNNEETTTNTSSNKSK